jgi:hypothetical protein
LTIDVDDEVGEREVSGVALREDGVDFDEGVDAGE